MKGTIKPDHIGVNKYQLLIVGLPSLTVTSTGGLEDTLITTEMPDHTRVTGGERNPTEFTMMIPEHHRVEQLAMEGWFREAQEPVLPSYKKAGTLVCPSISGSIIASYQLVGVFPSKRSTPDRDISNEGDMAQIEWTLSIDDIIPA